MDFPVGVDFLDRLGKGLVSGTDERRRLVLRAVRMDVVAVTKPVRVVEPNDREPSNHMADFQLDCALQNSFSATLVRTPQPSLLGLEFLNPLALDQVCFRHAEAPR